MFPACLFCHTSLGRNTVLEHAPAGRRFAFDEARGRLWSLCRSCGRWNLTPPEDRWEIIEECERVFRATRVRFSTDQIGLARAADGTELIRVGKPLRPEFAAWRYGRAFLSRRPVAAARVAGAASLVTAPLVLSALLGPLAPLTVSALAAGAAWRLARKPALSIRLSDRDEVRLSATQVEHAELIADPVTPEGWAILVRHLEDENPIRRLGIHGHFAGDTVLTGAPARAFAAFALPRLNPTGGSAGEVAEAVKWLEAVGGPAGVLPAFARSRRVRPILDANKATLATLHTPARLALEMAVHEEEEQRALRRDLCVLEWAWRREEALASLADRLAVPEPVQDQLQAARRRLAN